MRRDGRRAGCGGAGHLSSGNPVSRVLLYFVASLCAGGLLAGPVHLLLAPATGVSPERVTSRCVLIVALLLAPLFAGRTDVRRTLGLAAPPGVFGRHLGLGLVLGAASFLPHALALVASGARLPEAPWPALAALVATALPKAAATGLAVALVEELLFRGLVFGVVRRHAGPLAAAVTASLLYALAHFLRPEGGGTVAPHWTSGLQVLAGGLARFLAPAALAGDFVALALAGLALAWARELSGGIAACIGLHAAWVAGIKLVRAATELGTAHTWLVGEFDQVIGWLAAGWILLVLAGTRLALGRRAASRGPA
jgi:membrane protease YdiL (CAAX protease family)